MVLRRRKRLNKEDDVGPRVVSSGGNPNTVPPPPRWGLWRALLLVIRLACQPLINGIADCDEVYNYWEPLHYVAFGTGMQTWEYSPEFALRPYSYIGVHQFIVEGVRLVAPVLESLGIYGDGSVAIFYGVRIVLAALCVACELHFCRGVARAFGGECAKRTLALLALSSGMFHAGTALLPSTTCMYFVMVTWGYWMQERRRAAVWASVSGTLLCGWPFVALVFAPMALHVVLVDGVLSALAWGLGAAAIVLPPVALCDYAAYGAATLPLWNLVKYNIFPSEFGDELYGVEPASYFFVNGFLNLNVPFVLALALPVLLPLARLAGDPALSWSAVAFLLPTYLWFAVVDSRPHKEERFLFVIYPLVCLCGAVAVGAVESVIAAAAVPRPLRRAVLPAALFATALLSLARSASIHVHYHAPMSVWGDVHELTSATTSTESVCVGDEWHRFPSAFFLAADARLAFVQAGFDGQLPQPFLEHAEKRGTAGAREGFNDLNRGDPNRFVPVEECDWAVVLNLELDADAFTVGAEWPTDVAGVPFPKAGGNEVPPGDQRAWHVVAKERFLDASRSHPLFRAFYVPYVGRDRTAFGTYVLLRRNVSV